MAFKLNEYGEVIETDEVFTTGRFKVIDGKVVYVGAVLQGASHFAGSDDLGTKGVFNPADGKMYDSRAKYYNAVKSMGLEIMGNDVPKQSTPKLKPINWEKAVAETLKTNPLKGK